jgi:hypothetical protein
MLTYHGVLAHQDNTLASESMSDLVHLLRADIVDLNDEDGLVLLEQALELVEVLRLVAGFGPHFFLWYEAGCLRPRGIVMEIEVDEDVDRTRPRFCGRENVCLQPFA